jgi:glycine/D-amino acid oxidase-like deaminating enzyme
MHVDVVIVGQGIAGTLLADRLIHSGKRVAIIDQGLYASATAIAAGLMEPLSGRKLAKAWEAETVFPYALSYYEVLEKRLGISLLQHVPVTRYFSEEQSLLWEKKQKYFDAFPWTLVMPSPAAPYGGVCMAGAVVKTTRVLAVMRARFRRLGLLHERAVSFPETLLVADNPYGVWGDRVVCTAGVGIATMDIWKHLKLQYSAGEVLCLRHRMTPPLTTVLHDKKLWHVPYSSGQIRIGATYRPLLSSAVQIEGALTLQAYMRNLGIQVPSYRQHIYAGGRCLGIDGKFIVAEHPRVSGLWAFTGLGSKGVMLAPYLTAGLVERL